MNDRLQQLALFVRTAETGQLLASGSRIWTHATFHLSRSSGAGGEIRRQAPTPQISATDAGATLLTRVREALAAVEDAENAARGADQLQRCASRCRRVLAIYGGRRIAPFSRPSCFMRAEDLTEGAGLHRLSQQAVTQSQVSSAEEPTETAPR